MKITTQRFILKRKFTDKDYAAEVIDVAYEKYRKDISLKIKPQKRKLLGGGRGWPRTIRVTMD